MGIFDSIKNVFSSDVKVPDSVPGELRDQVKKDLKDKSIDNADVQTEFTVFNDTTLEGSDIVIPEEEDE